MRSVYNRVIYWWSLSQPPAQWQILGGEQTVLLLLSLGETESETLLGVRSECLSDIQPKTNFTSVSTFVGQFPASLPLWLSVVPCSQVGWYNSLLPANFHLAYPDDTLAVVVLSTPSMFEQAFLPFMEEKGCQVQSDPIDQCVKHCVSSAVSQVSWMCVMTNETD